MIKLYFSLVKIGKIPLYPIILIAILVTEVSAESESCIIFNNPVPWTQLKSSPCTLSVKNCPLVKSITFKAKYIPKDSTIPQIVTIGDITRPPYKLLWDISEIPNQLTYGITCLAEAKLKFRKKKTIKQEGIFLIHQPVESPEYDISYSDYIHHNKNRKSITLSSPNLSFTAKANISWDEKGLLFHIAVNNSHFHSALPRANLDKIGVKIYLDPQNKRAAYLSEDILVFIIPVTNMPFRISTMSVYDSDGSFDIKEKYDTCNYYCSVFAEDFKGYTIKFSIPQRAFGSGLPISFGCNVIATVMDENSSIKEISWVQDNGFNIRSPFVYGKLTLLEKPILANPLILWILCFIIGLILGIIAIPVYKTAQRFNTLIKFEDYEHEEELLKNMNTIVNAEVTNKNFTVEDIASKLSIPPKKIDKLIKHHFGRSFKRYLLFSRIEIVKERLRSSNASEISIANSCGFSSINEMEKAFRTFNGITPYKYREENRIF